MIMRIFAEGLNFTGKAVLPIVTYAVSGQGRAAEEYATACPGSTIGDALAVRGEKVAQAGDAVSAWMQCVNLR